MICRRIAHAGTRTTRWPRICESTLRPATTFALMDIGQIGYETGLPIIDISGLVTP